MSSAHALLDREILFVGGKGGVGKTTLAAVFALQAADIGHRTLLVSTDPAHSTGDILETALTSDPRQVTERLWALEIDPAREADRYIADVKHRIAATTTPRLLEEVERQIDAARVSPGAEEAALFERFTRILEESRAHYDRVVFDTAPTGLTLRLLSLPELMTAWIGGLIDRRSKVNALGRMWRIVSGAAAAAAADGADPILAALEERRERFKRARSLLTDATRVAFVFVVIPERLPIMETEKAVRALDKYGIPVGGIIVNRVLPDAAEGAFLASRRERERGYLAAIDRAFAAHPRLRVPLLGGDVVGIEALRALFTRLGASLSKE